MVTTCASVLGMACPDLGSGGSVSTIPSRPRARKQAWPSQVRSMEWAENTRNTAPAEGVSRLTDQEIVKLCLGGDADAYATLVERYGGRAYNIALRITNDRDAANDCAQEAFIRAYRALHQYDPALPFGPWLFRITTNASLNYIQRWRGHETAVEELPESADEPDDRPEATTLRREEVAEVVAAMADLPV